jgi:hypothetical protein
MNVESFRRMEPRQLAAVATSLWRGVFAGAEMKAFSLEKILNGTPGNPAALPEPEDSGFYVAVRAKRHPVIYRQMNQARHGIALRDWDSFQRADPWSRRFCFVGYFEAFADEMNQQWSGALLLQSLHKLGEPMKGFGPMADTAFWPRARFVEIGRCKVEQIEAVQDQKGMPDDWKAALRDLLLVGETQPAQRGLF